MPPAEEIDVDAIMNEALAPEAPMEAPREGHEILEAESSQKESGTPPAADSTGHNITYKGEELSVDSDRYKNLAQQGYDYNKKMHDFKVEQKMWEADRQKKDEQYEELKQINDYAVANPAFAQMLKEKWALQQSGQGQALEPQDQMAVISSQFAQIQAEQAETKERETIRSNAEKEARQEAAIDAFKQENSEYDWASKNDMGQTLEDRIGDAMLEKHVKDFEIMADHFLKKEMALRKAVEGGENAAKKIQKANKMGLGKLTAESQMKAKQAENISSKSYDDLMREFMTEEGIG